MRAMLLHLRLYKKQLRRMALRALLLGVLLSFVGGLSSIVFQSTVHANGGSGGGGGGAGGCGIGPCTTDGDGWAAFNTNGPAPSYIFGNGTDLSDGTSTYNWQYIQAQCNGDGAQQIYAFVIRDNSDQTGVYTYTSGLANSGPNFTTMPNGNPVDSDGGGTPVPTSTAQSNFATFQTDFPAQSAGLVWNQNVGWFCWDYNPTVTISGLVYYYNGAGSIGLDGVRIDTCPSQNNSNPSVPVTSNNGSIAGGNATDGAGGGFKFTINNGDPFCVRVPSSFTAPDGTVYSNPVITPGSIKNGPAPGGPNGYCGSNDSSYEFQVAGSTSSGTATCNYGIGDNGYNFAYTKQTPPTHIIGNIDQVSCSNLVGWGDDTTVPNQDIRIDVYINGPAGGGGTGIYSGYTNVYRPDVNAALGGISGNHGFNISISAYTSNGSKSLYVYGISTNGVGLIGVGTTPASCTPPSACPPPPWVGANGAVNVNVPDAPQPSGTYSSPPPTYTYSPGPYSYATPGAMEINSAYDQYSNPTNITWTATGYQDTNNFTLYYENYIQQYPYDSHQTTVNYTQQYSQTDYNTTFDHWECWGGTYIGNGNCQYTYTWSSGSYCSTYDANGNCTAYSNYSCSPYAGGTSGTCTYTYYYSATPVYRYYQTAGPYTVYSNGSWGGAPVLPELCLRNFQIQNPTNTDVQSVTFSGGTPDNPSQVTIATNTQVLFNLDYHPYVGIRNPFQVNGVSYLGQYYIKHADGTTTPFQTDNQTFNIDTSLYTDNSTYNYPYSVSYSVSIPPLAVGDEICAEFTVSPQQGQTDQNGTIQPGTASGYVNSTQIPGGSTCSGPILDQPYTRSYGNDIASGPQFAGTNFTCDPSSAGLIASPDDQTKQPRGSGTQFMALSLGSVKNYSSAFLRSFSPNAVNGLTLSNTQSPYGNFVGSGGSCPTIFNYYALKPSSVTPINALGGYYTLPLSGQISGKNLIYVDGNVYIPNNITFAPATIDPSSGSINGTSLYVVALGNIYIGPGVTNLDGVFVAENGCDVNQVTSCSSFNANNGGLINTCADISAGGSSKAFPQDTLYDSCTAQLTVRGALVADQVKLDRSYGSIRNSLPAENPLNFNTHDCSVGNYLNSDPYAISPSFNQDCSAEVFNFDPVNYSNNPGLNSDQKTTYDSIVSLPPVL